MENNFINNDIVNVHQLFDYLTAKNKRLAQPCDCPDVVNFLRDLGCNIYTQSQMYNLMLKCWNMRPYERPTFEAIQSSILDMTDEQLE